MARFGDRRFFVARARGRIGNVTREVLGVNQLVCDGSRAIFVPLAKSQNFRIFGVRC